MAHFSCAAEGLIQSARVFANAAHRAIDQRRKYTNEPYIVHPMAVSELVGRPFVNANWEMICAAWLHDVVEDTKVTLDIIHHLFGDDVGRMVGALTNSKEGTRLQRHERELVQIGNACGRAQTIRCADIIDNTKDIARLDPHFADRYLREKWAILEAMPEANPQLHLQAMNQVMRAQEDLIYV